MAVFDRTFAVTEVLTWLAGGVAFCGLAGSSLALALARQARLQRPGRGWNDRPVYNRSGCRTSAIIAWTAAIVASVSGTLLAFVLAYVVQYRSFGWSIPTTVQPRFCVQNFALATAAAAVGDYLSGHPLAVRCWRERCGMNREE